MPVHLHVWRQRRAPHLRPGPRRSVAVYPEICVTHDSAFRCPILVPEPTASLSPRCLLSCVTSRTCLSSTDAIRTPVSAGCKCTGGRLPVKPHGGNRKELILNN